MGITSAHFFTFGVTFKPRFLILLDKVLIKADLVALLICDRLKAQILEKPDQLIHDPGSLSKLLGATPGAFA